MGNFKQTIKIPGDILELGVLKGASLIRWATFRNLENSHSRKLLDLTLLENFLFIKMLMKTMKFISDHDEYAENGLI